MAANKDISDAAERPPGTDDSALLDQALLDELAAAVEQEVVAGEPEQVLGQPAGLDDPVVAPAAAAAPTPEAEVLGEIDALAEGAENPESSVVPEKEAAYGEDGLVAADLIASLVAAADEEVKPAIEPAGEPPAGEEHGPGIEVADGKERPGRLAGDELPPVAAPAGLPNRPPMRLRNLTSSLSVLRVAFTLTAAAAVGVGVFMYLHQRAAPNPEELSADAALADEWPLLPQLPKFPSASIPAAEVAPPPVEPAPEDNAMPETPPAVQEPEQTPAAEPAAPPEEASAPQESVSEPDPVFQRLADICKDIESTNDEDALNRVLDEVNRFLEQNPVNSNIAGALKFKGQIYKQKKMAMSAYDFYRQIMNRPGIDASPDYSQYVIDAAAAALEARRGSEAVAWLEKVVVQVPEGQHNPEADMLLARCYAASGRVSDSSAMYVKLMQTQPGTRYEFESAAALAQVALDQGRYEDAVKLIEPRLAAKDGGDVLRLNLARAYKGVKRTDDARRMLKELVTLYAESPLIAVAMCEHAELLQDAGLHPQALEMANKVVETYPNDSRAILILANLLRLGEDKRAAAEMYMRAADSGVRDPEVLLTAARQYVVAAALKDAEKAYQRLLTEYPRGGEAFEGRLELGRLLCANGKAREGLSSLEDLARRTENTPQHLPVIIALGNAYKTLGFQERAGEVYKKVASASAEPDVLAQSATALLTAGAHDEGLGVAAKVDLTKVSGRNAVGMLAAMAEAMRERDAPRSAQLLETIRDNYANQWNTDLEMALLKSHVASGNVDAARGLLDTMYGRIDEKGGNNAAAKKLFREGAIVLADYLTAHNVYADAAVEYEAVARMGAEDDTGLWAQYQRADALAQLGEIEAAAALYDEVATSNAVFAPEAALKASNRRMQQRLNGGPALRPKEAAGGR